jgi:hypothetical protein
MFTVKNMGSSLVYLGVIVIFYLVLVFVNFLNVMFGILERSLMFKK